MADKESFLVYISLTSPHKPLAVNPEWKNKSKHILFADFVMVTDAVMRAANESRQDTPDDVRTSSL